MRIVIDARMMGPGKTRGIGRYIEEVIRGMLPHLKENETLVLLERDPEHSPFTGSRIEHQRADIPWYGIAEQFRMPGLIKRTKPDLYWVPHWNAPVFYRGPAAITIHDLLLMHVPSSAKASTRSFVTRLMKRLGYRLVIKTAIARARVILAPSQFVADDLRKRFPMSRSRVVITGEGMTKFPASVRPEHLPDSYLLYVGSAYPHKRLDLLLEAWQKVSENHPTLHLVLAGEKDVFMKKQQRISESRGLQRIHFMGRVSDAELASLYEHAKAFIFPTSFEGFGLPPLEALAHACPVIASDIPVLKEVLPETGTTFFQNGSANDMIRAISKVLEQGEKAREAARLGGREAQAMHDWDSVAKRTLAALRDALIRKSHAPTPPST